MSLLSGSVFDFLAQFQLRDLIQDIGVCQFNSNAFIKACTLKVSILSLSCSKQLVNLFKRICTLLNHLPYIVFGLQ